MDEGNCFGRLAAGKKSIVGKKEIVMEFLSDENHVGAL
jgi:hypothetical protein